MKKFFLTLALAAVATSAFAQIEGLSAGAGYLTNTRKVTATYNNTSDSDKQEFGGFYAGVSYTVLHVGPGIGITPGIYFSNLSYKKDADAVGGVRSGSENNISVPVNFSYKLDLLPGTLALAPYLGPTFIFGLSSKDQYALKNHTDITDNYGDNSDYGRFNVAVGGGIALDIVDMIRVTLGYNLGLLNLYTGDNSGNTKYSYKNNTGFNFGVAYLF